MNHESIEQYLAEYVDGTLPPKERVAVEDYLRDHPEEAETVRFVQRIQPMVRSLPDEEIPVDLTERIFSATTRRRRFFFRNKIHKMSLAFRLAPVVGIALAAIVVGVVTFSHMEGVFRNPDAETALLMSKSESVGQPPAIPVESAMEAERSADEDEAADKLAAQPATGVSSLVLKEQFAAGDDKKRESKDADSGFARGPMAEGVAGRLEEKYDAAPAPMRRAANEVESRSEVLADLPAAVPPPAPAMLGGAMAAKQKGARESSPTRNDIPPPDESDEAKTAESAAPVAQRWEGQYSGITAAGVQIVTDRGQWSQLWGRLNARRSPAPPAPVIDFKTQAVVAVFLGQRNTGGFIVRIQEIHREGNDLVVTVRETTPAAGQMLTMALTQPYSLVVVPRTIDGLTLKPNTTIRIVKQ